MQIIVVIVCNDNCYHLNIMTLLKPLVLCFLLNVYVWRSSLSVYHWNLNSIWVEDSSKLSQISAVLNVHQFDIFCLGETFLDSSISSENPRLAIEGYNLFRCDHPSNLRKVGVCLYFKDHLPLALKPNLTTLDKRLVCEI